MSKKEPINEEFFNEIYIKKPIYIPFLKNWNVHYVESGKWVDKFFKTEKEALNFYFEKLNLFKFWIMSEFKEYNR